MCLVTAEFSTLLLPPNPGQVTHVPQRPLEKKLTCWNLLTCNGSLLISSLIIWACLAHLGLTAVVVSPETTTPQPGQGPRWRPAVATLGRMM